MRKVRRALLKAFFFFLLTDDTELLVCLEPQRLSCDHVGLQPVSEDDDPDLVGRVSGSCDGELQVVVGDATIVEDGSYISLSASGSHCEAHDPGLLVLAVELLPGCERGQMIDDGSHQLISFTFSLKNL